MGLWDAIIGKGIKDLKIDDLKLNYSGYPCKFDTELVQPAGAGDNAKLWIRIKQWLVKVSAHAKGHKIKDANGDDFDIQEWTDTEWQNFTNTYKTQCENTWDFRFWLVPPDDFTTLDADFSGTKIRPNIECRLELLTGSATSHHKKIEVCRLADKYHTHGNDSSTFRSNAVLYDSLDTTMHIFQVPDDKGTKHDVTHYTIPHELGHSLGMWHAGTLYKDQYCTSKTEGGGLNSAVCYGYGRPPQIGENIMGFGLAVTEVNALPWLHAVGEHIRWNDRPNVSKWKVVLHNDSSPTLDPKRL
jgi:hypothetical protein